MQTDDADDSVVIHAFQSSDWELISLPLALRIAFGFSGIMIHRLAMVFLLMPTVLLAVFCAWTGNSLLVPFILLSLWGFASRSSGPTGIGMLGTLVAGISGVLAGVVTETRMPAVVSWLPGLTWLASCAFVGTATQYLISAAASSEETFQRLVAGGAFRCCLQKEQHHDPTGVRQGK